MCGVWAGEEGSAAVAKFLSLFFLTGSLLIKAYTIKASPFLPMQHCKFLPVLANPSIISPCVQRVTWEGISSFLLWELCLLRSRRPAQQLSPGDTLLTSPTSWLNARVGDGTALVPVAVISLDPNAEGGRLAFLGLSPSPCGDTLTISFSLFTSSQNILPAEVLKEEGRLLGLSLFVALKVGSSHTAFVEKALVNAGDVDSSLEQKRGRWVGLGGSDNTPSQFTG